MKGKTIIELTDIRTGAVTVKEDDNFITNALNDICQPILRNQDSLPTTLFQEEEGCSIEALTRGLLLFSEKLDDDAASYFPPETVKMVGHAGAITYTGSDVSMGSFNTNQSILSGADERSYVWDFTSEQANGVINSICLTTQCGGVIGHGSETPAEEVAASLKPFSNIIKAAIMTKWADTLAPYARVPIYVDFKNDCFIFCDFSKFSMGQALFYRVALDSNVINIFSEIPKSTAYPSFGWTGAANIIGHEATKVEVINFELPSDFGSGVMFGLAQDGKYLYMTSRSATAEATVAYAWAPESAIKILKIDLETFETSTLEVVNTTGVALAIRTSYTSLAAAGYTFGVVDNRLFVREWVATAGSEAAELYSISLEDNTDVVKVQTADGKTKVVGISNIQSATPFVMSIQGKVCFIGKGITVNYGAGTSTPLSILHCVSADDPTVKYLDTSSASLYTQGSFVPATSVSARCYPTSDKLYFGVERRGTTSPTDAINFINIVPNVLMTINNLSEPIEKTPAQTMRITYKLIKE